MKVQFAQLATTLRVGIILTAKYLRVRGTDNRDGKDVADMWVDKDIACLMVQPESGNAFAIPLVQVVTLELATPAKVKINSDTKRATV